LWIAYAKEQKLDQLLAKAVRTKNRDEVISSYINGGPDKLAAKIRESSIPGYKPKYVITPDWLHGEKAYDAVAKGGYTKYLAGTHKYLLLMIEDREQNALRGPMLLASTAKQQCVPAWCAELEQEMNVGQALAWFICGSCFFQGPACIVECAAIGAYVAFMNYRFGTSCSGEEVLSRAGC
jgi:hypothetical protein